MYRVLPGQCVTHAAAIWDRCTYFQAGLLANVEVQREVALTCIYYSALCSLCRLIDHIHLVRSIALEVAGLRHNVHAQKWCVPALLSFDQLNGTWHG